MSIERLEKSWQDIDVLRWLGTEAPRYTSYPSAHHFVDLGPDIYVHWLEALRPDQSLGLYVHLPFCEQMCHFCGCNTQITRRYEPVQTYIAALIKEIGMVCMRLGGRPPVHSLHFGGGSPGILEPSDLSRLFDVLHRHFQILSDAEISIELDPRRVTKAKARNYAALGFNRASLGVQDTQTIVQEAINRVQPADLVIDTMALLRDQGLTSLGIDLVYGLPHQTSQTLEKTLADVEILDPDRLSAFSYAHVPWVKKHQRLVDASILPGLEQKTDFYLQIAQRLNQIGYESIGIDHFAKPEDGLAKASREGRLRRNFMGYTDQSNDRLLGFGASSIGELDGGIVQNIAQATSYKARIAKGVLPTMRGWVYRDDDLVRKAVIMSLMCNFQADLAEILQSHGYPESHLDGSLAALSEFEKAGFVLIKNRNVVFRSPLKMLVRSVCSVFDTYAAQASRGYRYSKVA